VLALVLAWAYSMPPVRLKQNGWWGNLACGLSYEGLAWITGAALLAGGMAPSVQSLTFAVLYSLCAHGIMTLNDFKAIEGDRRMGVRSLPVQLGVDRAARLACWVMIVPQVIVLIMLLYWDRSNYALAIAGLIVCQLVLMRKFLSDPVRYALFYSGFGVPLLVSGMMVSAFAIHAFGAR
jgi:chlorophyll synthase